jgi:hypothetical protein
MYTSALFSGLMARNVAINSFPLPFRVSFRARCLPVLPMWSSRHGLDPGSPPYLLSMTHNDLAVLPIILTQDQVATLLQVPARTLEDWRLTRSGPPYRKIGRHVRYERDDVITWFRRRPDHA